MKNLYDYERTQSATTDLPFGALKNESSPGKQDGTDIVAEHIQDLAYSLYQVLQLAGINPNGELEDGNNKTQFIESLTNIGVFRYSDKTSYNYGVFAWQVIGNTFTLYRSLKNSNSDDVNNNESWLKILEIGADNKINFNVDTNILGLSANPSLSNLSEAGEDRLNVSKMYETGAVSNDTKGFKELLKRAHSTFDKSKFTIEGSPTISDDGVASGFSASNNIKPKSLISFGGKSWAFNAKFIPVNNSIDDRFQPIFSDVKDAKTNFFIGTDRYGTKLVVQIKDSTNANFIVQELSLGSLNLNVLNSVCLVYKNQKLNVICNDSIILDKNANLDDCTFNNLQTIGYSSAGVQSNYGSIDLKSIAVWAGSVPVFNGNKTGLYVAKPDNYTVEGSPTISDDGIASGFSNENYFKTIQLSQLKGKSWEIHGKWINKGITAISAVNTFFDFGGWTAWGSTVFNFSTKNLSFNRRTGVSGDTNNEGAGIVKKFDNIPSYIQFIYGFNIKTGNYYAKIEYGEGWKDLGTSTVITENKELYYINEAPQNYIRIGAGSDNTYNRNAFDIYSFKVYIEGDLAYQTGLKIPYTETFEHPNVVDVAYRNRVQDLYEQTGEALFYTIDEQNQNFTLPSGDIYGMITKNREILDIVYPIGRPMPEENNVLLDNEVWLEGATVNIVDYPKLFKVYGTKYGGDGTTTFKLSDLRNRVLWGSSDGSNGYIESKLPNIKGDFILGGDGGTHPQTGSSAASGAYQFTSTSSGATFENTGAGQTRYDNINFNASRSNSIYSDSTKIVQPPAFKVRWKTRFE